MAVAISNQTPSPAGVAGSGNTVTYSGAAIGTASNDRMVVVAVTSEDGTATVVTGVTVGGSPLQKCVADSFNASTLNASLWWGNIGSGTTADIIVTYTGTAPVAAANHISVHVVTGAEPSPSAVGSNTSTDMDATAKLTLAVTVPANGGVIAVAAGAVSTSAAKTWGGNATKVEEIATGNYCHTTATGTTSGATTITCQGTTNQEDGVLAVLVLAPASGKPQNRQSEWPTPKSTASPSWFYSIQQSGSLALTGQVPLPFNQYIWPNPTPLPPPNRGFTFSKPIPPDTNTYMPAIADFGSPPPPIPPSPQVVYSSPLTLLAPQQAPFANYDWPNPKPAVTQQWRPDGPNLPLNVRPFVQTDWPNPRNPAQAQQQQPFGLNLPLNVYPFVQTDWPNPRNAPQQNLGWINQAIRDVVAQMPFSQTDWPNPKPLVSPPNFTFSLPLQPDTNSYMPCVVTEWTMPAPIPPQQPRVHVNLLPLTSVQVQMPFNQYSWPNPQTKFLPTALLTWTNGLPPITYVQRQPIINLPKPIDPTPARLAQLPANVLPLIAPPQGKPFFQTDWPNPKPIPPLPPHFFLPLNLALNVEPPPVTDEIPHHLPFFATMGQLKSF